MKRTLVLSTLFLLVLMFLPTLANAKPEASAIMTSVEPAAVTTVHFDDLGYEQLFYYAGITWDSGILDYYGTYLGGWHTHDDPGYATPVSPPNVAFNWYGAIDPGFTFDQPVEFWGAHFMQTMGTVATPYAVRCVGYLEGTPLYTSDWLVITPKPQYLAANFPLIDRVVVEMDGMGWFAMDDLVYELQPEFQYHFQLNPYNDVIHINANPGGWLNGIDDAITYQGAPVLGYVEYGYAYMSIDFPDTAYWDMAFLVINIASRDGWMMRITEALELAPPEYIWLTPAAVESMEGPSIGEASEGSVTPQAWYDFVCNPYADVVSLNTDMAPWLWGVCNVPGGHFCYPAPVLGYTQFGKFYFAMDYVDAEPACYAMSFWAGTIATRDGHFIRTSDGYSIVGPEYFWLTIP
jgi:hypothetical protein